MDGCGKVYGADGITGRCIGRVLATTVTEHVRSFMVDVDVAAIRYIECLPFGSQNLLRGAMCI